jgi:hypothetical protein
VEACEACGITVAEQRVVELIAEGMTYAEAGAVMGRTKQRIGQVAERLRKKLRLPGPLYTLFLDALAVRGTFGEVCDGRADMADAAVQAAYRRARMPLSADERRCRDLDRQATALLRAV